MMRSASGWIVAQMMVETGESFQRCRRSLMRAGGPTRATSSTSWFGTSAVASLFLPDEVEVLDLRRLALEAVAAGELVVEVLALGAHAADVERELGLDHVEARLDVVADDDGDGHRDVELRRLLAAASWRSPPASDGP